MPVLKKVFYLIHKVCQYVNAIIQVYVSVVFLLSSTLHDFPPSPGLRGSDLYGLLQEFPLPPGLRMGPANGSRGYLQKIHRWEENTGRYLFS